VELADFIILKTTESREKTGEGVGWGCKRKQQGTCPVLKNNKKVTSPSKIGLLFGYENFKENELGATSLVDGMGPLYFGEFYIYLQVKNYLFEKNSR
jgi:hypothetical protein